MRSTGKMTKFDVAQRFFLSLRKKVIGGEG